MTTTKGPPEQASAQPDANASPPATETTKDVLFAALVSIALCVAYQLTYGHFNLNMRDEGYLWYGVQAVLAGEVPLRDFQSYDPGRYYWCQALSSIFGTGVVAVRASLVTFSCFGLWAGLLLIRRLVPQRSWLLPAGCMLVLSLFSRHKLFEPSIVLIAIWGTTRMIEKPSLGRVFSAGLIVGLATFIGRNHGLYLAVAFAALFLFGLLKRLDPRPWRSAGVLTLGVIIGYSPMLFMLAWVPGFGDAFVDALLSVKTVGSNISEPYFWPWSPVPDDGQIIVNEHWIVPYSVFALRIAYLMPVLLLPVGCLALLRPKAEFLRRHAVLVASVFVAIPYTYHYAIRSDVPHLFQAIQPVVLTGLGLAALSAKRKLHVGLSLGFFAFIFGLVASTKQPELKQLLDAGHNQQRMQLEIQGDLLSIPEKLAKDIEMIRSTVSRALPSDEPIFIVPTMPTYYPILGKRSPSWWIYLLWHSSEEEQRKIVDELKNAKINTIITVARPFNKNADFNLNVTNPILWRYILNHFERVVSTPELPLPQRIHVWLRNPKL